PDVRGIAEPDPEANAFPIEYLHDAVDGPDIATEPWSAVSGGDGRLAGNIRGRHSGGSSRTDADPIYGGAWIDSRPGDHVWRRDTVRSGSTEHDNRVHQCALHQRSGCGRGCRGDGNVCPGNRRGE